MPGLAYGTAMQNNQGVTYGQLPLPSRLWSVALSSITASSVQPKQYKVFEAC